MNPIENGRARPLISLPRRGIRVIPPFETRHKMALAAIGLKVTPFTLEEKTRLRQIINAGVFLKRYPTPEEGRKFMESTDYAWGEELLKMANELAVCIANSWTAIDSEKPIAIILFGSVARGLAKKPDHPDPSNIDMAVIGKFTEAERVRLYNEIRPKREEVTKRVRARSPQLQGQDFSIGRGTTPANAGVTIQSIDKLETAIYSETINYIQGSALPLYDPAGIWERLEIAALNEVMPKRWKYCSMSKSPKRRAIFADGQTRKKVE